MEETTSLEELEVLLVDCQASGASPSHGEIIDIAWCTTSAAALGQDEALAIEATLVALPEGERLRRRIARMTGISNEALQEAPSQDEVARRLDEALGAPAPMPVAHYARFERPFLAELLAEHTERDGLPELLCTHEIARRLLPGLPRRGLRALAGYFGRVLPEHKRAGVHVEATAVIWRALVELLVEEEAVTTLAELDRWLETTEQDRSAARHFPLPREERLGLPERPGVYRMVNRSGEVLYVGKATSLKQRVNSYFRGKKGDGERKLEMATQVHALAVTPAPTPLEAALLEADEIKRLAPPYNQQLRERDRQIWFASRDDLLELRPLADPDHPLGPFTRREPLESLGTLQHVLAHEEVALELLHDADEDDEATFRGGLELWRQRHELEPGPVPLERLLDIGEAQLERYLAARAARRAAREAQAEREADEVEDEDEDVDDELEEEDGGGDDDEWVWTPEAVARSFDRLPRRVVHRLRRGRWVARLVDATLCWRPPYTPQGPRRMIAFEGGQIVWHAEICDDEIPPWPEPPPREPLQRLQDLDVATYDRLSVLWSELRRLVRQGHWLELRAQGTSWGASELRAIFETM